LAAAGAATTAVGTGVAGVGAATDSAATVLDSAADAIIKGEAPDVVKPALALGQRLLEKALRRIPGLGGKSTQAPKSSAAPAGGHIIRNCKALEDGLPGAQYRGGKYSKIKEGGKARGQEAHHMPADSVSTVGTSGGPAIQMDKADHAQTASHDNKPGSAAHRSTQAGLMGQGKAGFLSAMMMDVQDVESKFPGKYTSAIAQMMAYARCMGHI
jgi:hypothetical protein